MDSHKTGENIRDTEFTGTAIWNCGNSCSALDTNNLFGIKSNAAMTTELFMSDGLGTARQASNCVFGDGVATVGTKQASRCQCSCWLSRGMRGDGIELQTGYLHRKSLVSAFRFQRCIRCNDSLRSQRLKLLVVDKTVLLSVCVDVKIIRHDFWLEYV